MQTVRHPARIRTFHRRRGRLSGRHRDVLGRLWARLGLDVVQDGDRFDPVAAFGRRAPLVLEIGSGMGEATAEMAGADPGRDYLAVDVHTPGLAHLLDLVEQRGLSNVRVARGDALDLLAQLPPGGLDAVHVFFPDPWPKARHHKRRLLQPVHVPLLRDRLAPGGHVYVATDWADYAHAALAALAADPLLANAHPGFAPRPAHRPRTKFERRAERAGREVFDLVFHRTGEPADESTGERAGEPAVVHMVAR